MDCAQVSRLHSRWKVPSSGSSPKAIYSNLVVMTQPHHHNPIGHQREGRPPEATRPKKRLFLYNGWLRAADYQYLWMKHLKGWLEKYYGEEVVVVGNTLAVNTSNPEIYIQDLAQLVGNPDEDTFFLGQSIGCQVIMRFLAQLPLESRVGGFLALGCWLSLDFETQRKRSDALERLVREDWENFQRWTDRSTIDFQRVRAVCPGKLMAFISDNDPFRGLDDGGAANRRDWEEVVGARIILRPGQGHFNVPQLEAQDLRFIVEELLGLTWRPESMDGLSSETRSRSRL